MGSGSSTIAPSPTVVVNVDRNKDGPPGALPPATCDKHGDNCFWGAVAAPYLTKAGLKANALEDPGWVKDPATADKVAAAVMQWALDRGGSSFAHWFQPMCGFKRHGQSGCVQLAMFEVGNDRKCFWQLRGKDLLRGETDGSSYPSGNLRATHMAGAYLTIDPLSAMFLSDDCIMIPACMVSYAGEALDEKTPLHRAEQALSREGVRLFKLLGHSIGGLYTNIGLEQELFFVPDDAYKKRPDLVMTGRTLLGRRPAVTQKGDTHYMAPLNRRRSVYACMKEIQAEAFKLGIPLKTRHREVAPNQYEFAPLFGRVVEQVDNNLMVMQICEEVAPRHGLRALLAEKPFAGVNGSGKHNNWGLNTDTGKNLFAPGKTAETQSDFTAFTAALAYAINNHGDVIRAAVACAGNDHRLGAQEAPPAVISLGTGLAMEEHIKAVIGGGDLAGYGAAGGDSIGYGTGNIQNVTRGLEDRNRTAPFPFCGNRYEFRAVGSSQNIAMPLAYLNAAVADGCRYLADLIEGGASPRDAVAQVYQENQQCIFNGNGYDPAWLVEAEKRGLPNLHNCVEAWRNFNSAKNVELFTKTGVFTEAEVHARQTVQLEEYANTILIEGQCAINMADTGFLPALAADLNNYGDSGLCGPRKAVYKQVANTAAELRDVLDQFPDDASAIEQADYCVDSVKTKTAELREIVDTAERLCDGNLWPYPKYEEILFSHHSAEDLL